MLPLVLRFEVSPFFDWSMYSGLQQIPKRYSVAVLSYNNHEVYNPSHTWNDHQQMMITYTLGNFIKYQSMGDTLPYVSRTATVFTTLFGRNKEAKINNDGSVLADYPNWLKKYLQQQVGVGINTITLTNYYVGYTADHRVRAVDSFKFWQDK